jgi:hypothetical protein
MVRKFYIIVFNVILASLLIVQIGFCTQVPIKLDIEENDVLLPNIKSYINILDGENEQLKELNDETVFKARINDTDLKLNDIRKFKETGEGILYTILFDISKSIDIESFTELKQKMVDFINKKDIEDYVTIITFGEEVKVIIENSNSNEEITGAISNISLTDKKTRFYESIERAIDLNMIENKLLPVKRAIMVFSDGKDDFIGGITKSEIIKKINTTRFRIFGFGIYNGKLTEDKQISLNLLGEIARTTKGLYYQQNVIPFDDALNDMQDHIDNSYVLYFENQTLEKSTKIQNIYISAEFNSSIIHDESEIRLINKIADTIKPEILKLIQLNDYSFEIYFSEDVDGILEKDNYYVLSDRGEEVVDTLLYENHNDVYKITLTLDKKLKGTYLVELTNIRDKSLNGNQMDKKMHTIKTKRYFSNQLLILVISIISFLVLIFLIIIIKISRKKTKEDNETVIEENKNIDIYKGKSLIIEYNNQNSFNGKKEINFTDRQVIGRSENCDITFVDDEISRKHCELKIINDELYIEDLNSTNKTILNGSEINGIKNLKQGDIINIGKTEIRIIDFY